MECGQLVRGTRGGGGEEQKRKKKKNDYSKYNYMLPGGKDKIKSLFSPFFPTNNFDCLLLAIHSNNSIRDTVNQKHNTEYFLNFTLKYKR
jgi:hypothetical protein